LENRGGLM